MMDNNSNMLSPEDEYIAFVVYLRNNGVWKAVSNVFGMLNETRPEDPIEFFRRNVKPDNNDSTAVKETRRAISIAQEKITVLRRDRDALTAELDSLDVRIRESAAGKRWNSVDEATEAEEPVFDSDHA